MHRDDLLLHRQPACGMLNQNLFRPQALHLADQVLLLIAILVPTNQHYCTIKKSPITFVIVPWFAFEESVQFINL